jgi:hypothetical protein
VRALACVADVVRIAAREQDDIAATHVLDVRVTVDPEHEVALFNDVQGADTGEADREWPQRSVRNDPLSAQTDAPEQLREQVVRQAICVAGQLHAAQNEFHGGGGDALLRGLLTSGIAWTVPGKGLSNTFGVTRS